MEENEVIMKSKAAKRASYELSSACSDLKKRALISISKGLWENRNSVIEANSIDLKKLTSENNNSTLLDRLLLDENRLKESCEGVLQVASLPDPVGEIVGGWTTRHGLQIRKVRVPLGVIGVIFESRPNVTIDISALVILSGNAVVLRGGSESINSNMVIVRIMKQSLDGLLSPDAIQLVESTKRSLVDEMLQLDGLIDVIIPRGTASFIKHIREISTVPVIETGAGNCHIFVNHDADFEMATKIIVNAKIQRPSVCNAVRKVLVHSKIASQFLPFLAVEMRKHSVRMKGCDLTRSIVRDIEEATEQDWYEEYMDLTLAIKVVDSLELAVRHINTYSSKHSEAIITNSIIDSNYFTWNVDSACVYVNASTRFTDGNQFGLGAEVGISTQKLHARGPMGLKDLTTTKYVIYGQGQIRE